MSDHDHLGLARVGLAGVRIPVVVIWVRADPVSPEVSVIDAPTS